MYKIRNSESPLYDSCSREPANQTSLNILLFIFLSCRRYSKSKCFLNRKREPSSTNKPVRILL